MVDHRFRGLIWVLRFVVLGGILGGAAQYGISQVAVSPATMPKTGTVDEGFQAYNVEMLEVTGGRFWKPYKDIRATAGEQSKRQGPGSTPAGMNPDLYEYRSPIDLSNPRLRKLAAALGPTYIRVSGTWANSTYFYDKEGPPPSKPPKGFNGVLTRKQWKGVVDFAHAVNARIITSVAISPGTRNADGVWTPNQARQFFAYTKSIGGKIAATEFMNEPDAATLGGAPKGYDAADYGRDVKLFDQFLKQTSPHTLLLGPGSVGEGGTLSLPTNGGFITSEDMLKATGPLFDVFSYHIYAAVSQRCASMGAASQTAASEALSQKWLSSPDRIAAFYAGLRDRFDPGKPLWITETADAACGGNPWASTFLDTFRYLDWHGRLAQQGVRVMAHNTLASSDYGLLDEHTFAPRPDYWAALLWKRLMGTTVLNPGASPSTNLYLYAQCLRNAPGGVAILAINTNRDASEKIEVPTASERYTLTSPKLESSRVDLNGKELRLGRGDSLPSIEGAAASSGAVALPAASITFLAIAGANNSACR